MDILSIEGATRRMKPPSNWDEEKRGKCQVLAIRDENVEGANWMVSAWTMSVEEIARHTNGGPLYLSISGVNHPVVSMHVGEPIDEPPPAKLAMQIAMEFARHIEDRLKAHAMLSPQKRLLVSPLQHHPAGSFVNFATLEPGELVPPSHKDWRSFGPFAPDPGQGGE